MRSLTGYPDKARPRIDGPAEPPVVRARSPAWSPASAVDASSRRRSAPTASWSWSRRSASSFPPRRRCFGSRRPDRARRGSATRRARCQARADARPGRRLRHPAARRHRGAVARRLPVSGSDDGRAGDRPSARHPAAARPPAVSRTGATRRGRSLRLTVRVTSWEAYLPRLRGDPARRRRFTAGHSATRGRTPRCQVDRAARAGGSIDRQLDSLAAAAETAMNRESDAEVALDGDRRGIGAAAHAEVTGA